MIYTMAIMLEDKVLYELEVEADSVEEASYILWDNFESVAYATVVEEQRHPCGDCCYYPDCKMRPSECEYSDVYEGE